MAIKLSTAPAAVMPMYSLRRGVPDCDVVVYGATAEDLVTVPNPVVGKVALRMAYTHSASMFEVADYKSFCTKGKRNAKRR